MRTPLGFRRFKGLALAVQAAMLSAVNTMPTATNVTFTGTLSVGSTLTGDYDYSDPEGNAESGSTYQWYRADDASGTNAAAISGATNITYNVQAADMNKCIRFGVTPSDGTLVGSAAYSSWQQAWITNPLWDSIAFQSNFSGTHNGYDCVDQRGLNTFEWSTTTDPNNLSVTSDQFNSSPTSVKMRSTTGTQRTLRLPTGNPKLIFGTGDFTFEAWVRTLSMANTAHRLFARIGGNVRLEMSVNGNLMWNTYSGSSITAAAGMVDGVWQHVAVTRQAGVLRIFKNGVCYATETDTSDYVGEVRQLLDTLTASASRTTWVDDMRIIKGVAAYTENFTPPAAPLPTQYSAPSTPTGANGVVGGPHFLGATLTAVYDYTDSAGFPESGTTYQWYRADDASGTNAAAISGATASTYVVTSDDNGKYLRCAIAPRNGAVTGSQITTAYKAPDAALPVIAMIDTTNDRLETYQFNGATWSKVGNSLALTVSAVTSLAALTPTLIAAYDGSSDQIRAYTWDGTDWTLTGTPLTVAIGSLAICALNSTDIAVVDTTNDVIRAYRFNGSVWTALGNTLSLGAVTGFPTLAPLSSSRVAFYTHGQMQLKAYSFDGTNWSATGNALTVTGSSNASLAGFGAQAFAMIDDALDTLRRYTFDNTNWTLNGTPLHIGDLVGTNGLVSLSSNSVAVLTSFADTLRAYIYTGARWKPVGSGLTITGIDNPTATCLTYLLH